MNRKQRRNYSKELQKEKEIVENRKNNLRKQYGQFFKGDPFEQVNEFDKYGPLTITKNGLKAAPSTTYKIWGMMLRLNYNYIAVAAFGYVFKFRKRLKKNEKRFEFTKYKTAQAN
jgi:hypothetical protein